MRSNGQNKRRTARKFQAEITIRDERKKQKEGKRQNNYGSKVKCCRRTATIYDQLIDYDKYYDQECAGN